MGRHRRHTSSGDTLRAGWLSVQTPRRGQPGDTHATQGPQAGCSPDTGALRPSHDHALDAEEGDTTAERETTAPLAIKLAANEAEAEGVRQAEEGAAGRRLKRGGSTEEEERDSTVTHIYAELLETETRLVRLMEFVQVQYIEQLTATDQQCPCPLAARLSITARFN